MKYLSIALLSLPLAGFPPAIVHAQEMSAPKLLEVEVATRKIIGMPIHWGNTHGAMLTADGGLHLFKLEQVRNHRLLNENFLPHSLPEARSRLQAELGSRYQTLIAGPYVIAAPAGESSRWQARFIALLGGYTRYFDLRGWSLRHPDFPMIIIVFGTRQEFLQYAAAQSSQLSDQAGGCYFPRSNRCILYQIPGHAGTNWSQTEATIVHEAVHQLAFNTGVHERMFANPLWFVEGLATMFERPAVYELGVNRSVTGDRIHAEKLEYLRPLLENPAKLESLIEGLVHSDHLFETDPETAYALAWALTFYFAERMPSEYQTLMRLQSKRPYGDYPSQQRERDFQSAIQVAPSMLAARLTHFFEP